MRAGGQDGKRLLGWVTLVFFLCSCGNHEKKPDVTFMVAEPGHFHAALVLKSMYPEVDSTVYLYSPEGPEVKDFLNRVAGYANRSEEPAAWKIRQNTGQDFFERLLSEKPGNVLILAGNNQRKTEYISQAVKAGIHVFADKPMAINSEDFAQLEEAFSIAGEKGVLIYDIMTERFEITSILQRELAQQKDIFGELVKGSPGNPSVTKESVHHFFKFVSGTRLVRPGWFFDVAQEGEGIVDVTTHLIDLVHWTCFPDQIVDYRNDIVMTHSETWNTAILPNQFNAVTGLDEYPEYLEKYVDPDSTLQVRCNGSIEYTVKGVSARIGVTWNYQPPEGGGDTHFSMMHGSLARLEIRQGPEQHYRPELHITPLNQENDFAEQLTSFLHGLSARFPGLKAERSGNGYHVIIPEELRAGHEAHFAQVTRNFLEYLKKGNLPEWEVPNMLAKYRITTEARRLAVAR
jgi:predicted dehydrogenase